MKTICVLLAAGNSIRYGSNKLISDYHGKPLINYALDSIPVELFEKVVVVTQYEDVAKKAQEYGFEVVMNLHPEYGISHSCKIGLSRGFNSEACLFMVADQPEMRCDIIEAMLNHYERNPDKICVMSFQQHYGNPCIFPARFYPDLMNLEGDRGGSQVIKKNLDSCQFFETEYFYQKDIDFPEQ